MTKVTRLVLCESEMALTNCVCPATCSPYPESVASRAYKCKASGTLIVPLWHSALGGNNFSDFEVVDWMDLPSVKQAFIPGRSNSMFANENFRILALRIRFHC